MFAMAMVLLLGLSQCKKENTTTSNDEGARVPITLNVGGNGSRVAVEGETGVVTFENGDVLYVASNGTCVGTLTYNGENFAGEVTEPMEGEKLHFYFLGNKTPEFNSDNTGCSVIISDQTTELPVISYAPSRENYQVGKTDYNATLLNKCALVKFNVTTLAFNSATCIVGMNNKVSIGFADNSFEYGQDGDGVITMSAGNGEKWAILLPQDEVAHTNAYAMDGIYVGSCASIPAISENDYLTDGVAVAIGLPGGAIDGLFTVNANGDQVYFSQGNLQYQCSSNTWKFADHQYDYVGSDNAYNIYARVGCVDLFGWGTGNRPTNYDPINYFYATFVDWGNNAILNGGNQENSGWRTLSNDECNYIINERTTVSGIRYARAIVNDVLGIVLLPDDWSASTYVLNNTNDFDSGFDSNIIDAEEWTNTLESNGAVFFPAAGYRYSNEQVYFVNEAGFYWLSTPDDPSERAYSLNFSINNIFTDANNRFDGHSVRLVRDAE